MSGPLPTKSDVASSGVVFDGFQAADFKAYEKHKQGSMKFTLERRTTKDKLLAIARAVHESLGPELAGLELHASDEMPSVKNGKKVDHQLAFFTRDAEGQKALRALINTTNLQAGAALFDIALEHQHATLGLRLDESGVSVGVEIAARAKVDRDNVFEKLRQSWARERVIELVRALPAPAMAGVEEASVPAEDLTLDVVESWVAAGPAKSLRVSTMLVAIDPVLSGPGAVQAIADLVRAYLPLYRFWAWSRDNEHAGVKETIKKTAEVRQKKAVAFAPGDRVTILAGLFAGRAGYVAEIDAKGKAKVMVGPVSLSLEAKDLKSA